MTPSCYKPGRESGPWYEMFSIRRAIAGIEARGGDASGERKLYAAWLKDPEYFRADQANRGKGFYGELSVAADLGSGAGQPIRVGNDVPTPENDMAKNVTARVKTLAAAGKSTRAIAELLKAEGIRVSHMTVARKLLQGEML